MSIIQAKAAITTKRPPPRPAAPVAHRLGVAALGVLAAAVMLGGSVPVASAAARWTIQAAANPSAVEGAQVQFAVRITNVGDLSAPAVVGGDRNNCTPGAPAPADPANCYGVTATLPPGLTALGGTRLTGGLNCVVDRGANAITCQAPGHTNAQQVRAGSFPSFRIVTFLARAEAPVGDTLTATFEVQGAGAGVASTVETVRIGDSVPEFGVADFDGQISGADGSAFTQAAGHPFTASTAIEFQSTDSADPFINTLAPIEAVKDIVVDLPPGLVGSVASVDQCTLTELSNGFSTQVRALCPPTSQIGSTMVRANVIENMVLGPVPVFNMVPGSGVPARFGFNAFGSIVLLDFDVRSDSDFGLSAVVSNVPEGLPLQATELTLWGVPSDSSHDPDRACPGEQAPWAGGPSCPSGAARKALLRNPTACTPDGTGLTTTVHVASWLDPSDVKSSSFESHLPPAWPAAPSDWGPPQGPDGCERVPFDPELTGRPAAGASAGSPSGFSFDLSLAQTDDPDVVGQSDLRKAVVTLPQGVRVNPSSADGLAGCSSAQIGLDSRADPTCPDASKIGSLTVETPLLRETLEGGVYLATPFDNPFDSLIAIYLVARGPGVILKLPGHVSPDASKGGQLTATFDDQPQLPFSNLHLEFKGGPRAPIVLPKQCGTYTTRSVMTGWSGRVVEDTSSFTIDQGCGTTFSPGFSAGTETSAAGKSSPFLLRMTRDDADQELKSVSVDMPAGLTGKIADAVLCGEGQAAAGTCGGGSEIGNVTVGAGAGTHPFYITNGRVHITGPYKGAPFGLSIVVPAVAGPFDLGTVVVRSALFVDRHTAEIRVVSDPLPTQLQGIPLDVKDVRVTVDKDGFMINPTSCAEKQVGGRIDSTLGSSVAVSSRFQAYDCQALDLRPRMAIRVGGRRRTQRGRSTPLRTKLRMPDGGANLRQVRVTLPTVLNARLTVINDACTRAQYDSGSDECEFAKAGEAVAVTPLLRDPLRGGVYFVENGNPLPDLFVRLRGKVAFDLIGKITIPGSKRLRTTFDMVPDVPVSMFALRLFGGRDASVGNAANLCRRSSRRARVELDFVGQNGKVLQVDRRLRVKGCKQRSARARNRKRWRRGTRRGR